MPHFAVRLMHTLNANELYLDNGAWDIGNNVLHLEQSTSVVKV